MAAAQTIISLWRTEQDHERKSSYSFKRRDIPQPGILVRDEGDPTVAVTGMSWSGFRPNDDVCGFGFNITGNMFAAVELAHIAEIAS